MSDPARPPSSAEPARSESTIDRDAGATTVLGLTHELPKPKNWQDFQSRCVILFKEELRDPHCIEYGRQGQKQSGIDILCRRNGSGRHVGIQCRKIEEPLKEKKIRADVSAALALQYDFGEIIFATTAPDSTAATDAAYVVEQEFRAKGKDVRVVVYGWQSLQQLIVQHPKAYAVFNPNLSGESRGQPVDAEYQSRMEHKLDQLAETVSTLSPKIIYPADTKSSEEQEDVRLHARIDTYRDLVRDGQPKLAFDRLAELLLTIDPAKTPYAVFRVKSNMATASLNLGKEKEAAELWTEAYHLRPTDPRALTSLALARVVAGQPSEAMELAREALRRDAQNAEAVSALLQAAARSDWRGDPTSLIPDALRGTESADAGLLEFKRLQHEPTWVDDARNFAAKHKHPYFAHMAALAILERVIKSGAFNPDAVSQLWPGELEAAADTLKLRFERNRDALAASELLASGNNAAVALRLAGRYPEAIAVLQATMHRIGQEPSLVRMLGILQIIEGHENDGIATLESIPNDAEAQLVRAELTAASDAQAALNLVRKIDFAHAASPQREHRGILWAELSLLLNNNEEFRAALEALSADHESSAIVELFSIEGDVTFNAVPLPDAIARLAAAARTLDSTVSIITRMAIARKLSMWGDYSTAARVLEGHINLNHPSAPTKLYLKSLAASRRDDSFDSALANCSDETRTDNDVLWLTAAHAWNRGDVATADGKIDLLIRKDPRNLQAVLLKADILARQDRLVDLSDLLEQPLESFPSTRLQDQFRIVQLLLHFGYLKRACALAYRLFLEHRDQSRAWMILASVVLANPHSPEARALFDMSDAGPDAAVNVTFEGGAQRLFVIESDARLRALDSDSIEPKHELAGAVTGLRKDSEFLLPDGSRGTITQIRQKYVARFHYVLEHYERRFPTKFAFKTVPVDPHAAGGLDGIIQQLKERHDFVSDETREYANSDMPLGVLAHRVGVDIIDAAAGVVETGTRIKVCLGIEEERRNALEAIRTNQRKGCILDPWAFWIAYRLALLNVVVRTCGQLHLCQRTIDILQERKSRLESSTVDGLKTAAYDNGKIRLHEMSGEDIRCLVEELNSAITWAEDNAKIEPVHASDSLPDVAREFLQSGGTGILDECIAAYSAGLLLVSDDGPIRRVAQALGVKRVAWTQAVLLAAQQRGNLQAFDYARQLAMLLDAGQIYLGISPAALLAALRTDVEAGASTPFSGESLLRLAVNWPIQSHMSE